MCLGQQALATDAICAMDLRCEYLESPLGIDVTEPRLSWRLEDRGRQSAVRGQKQTAYRILVASSPEQLAQDQGDLWDTGKVQSSQTTQLAYTGEKLSSHMQCFWKVMVWSALSEVEGDVDGKPSIWSKSAHWSMGLLDPSDWQAEWIGFDQKPRSNPAQANKAPKIMITKAVYGAPGKPKKQVNVTAKIQAQVSAGKVRVNASNDLAGKDPAHGTKKVLIIDYTLNGTAKNITIPENSEVNIVTVEASKYLPAPHLRKEFKLA